METVKTVETVKEGAWTKSGWRGEGKKITIERGPLSFNMNDAL